MKWLFIAILVLLILSCGCGCTTVTQNNYNIKQAAEYSFVESATDIAFTIKPSAIPLKAKYVEVVFDKKYLGYFPVNQTIYLPKFTGSKRMTLIFSTAQSTKIEPKKELTITN
jgi:uncharacterized lipoprotein YmbA